MSKMADNKRLILEWNTLSKIIHYSAPPMARVKKFQIYFLDDYLPNTVLGYAENDNIADKISETVGSILATPIEDIVIPILEIDFM